MDETGQTDLLSHYATHWGLELEPKVRCTTRATIAFGHQCRRPVVLKIMRCTSDECRSASALRHFAGAGAVCCIDEFGDALLLEYLTPGTPLTEIVMRGDDDHAMQILCGVIRELHDNASTTADFPTVEQWGENLHRYLDGQQHPLLPTSLAARAERVYAELCSSQKCRRLLHGDLHHDNVLFDNVRGWVAIDPKGVVGEPEYEIGAALRNPTLDTRLYADTSIVERRLAIAAEELGFDRNRMAGWCFVQAVLSSVWAIEDGESEAAIRRGLAVAHATLPYL